MKRFLFATILTTALAGCSAVANEAPSDAPLESDLTAQDFDTTVQQLSALPWLPWTYLRTGCDSRAGYYSMLLASKGIPSNHIYALVKNDAPKLAGRWEWHVAPVVTKDGDNEHLWVLDPAFDQTKALTSVEWLARQNYPDTSASDYPDLAVVPADMIGSPVSLPTMDHPQSPDVASCKEPTFAEMQGYRIEFVTVSCVTMHEFIDLEETTTAKEKTEKHRALSRETQRLVAQLTAKGKIIYDFQHENIPEQQALGEECSRGEPAP